MQCVWYTHDMSTIKKGRRSNRKKNKNITISLSAIRHGKRVAKKTKRSFSGMLEFLVMTEHSRLFGETNGN